jgi:hypothetical protein
LEPIVSILPSKEVEESLSLSLSKLKLVVYHFVKHGDERGGAVELIRVGESNKSLIGYAP